MDVEQGIVIHKFKVQSAAQLDLACRHTGFLCDRAGGRGKVGDALGRVGSDGSGVLGQAAPLGCRGGVSHLLELADGALCRRLARLDLSAKAIEAVGAKTAPDVEGRGGGGGGGGGGDGRGLRGVLWRGAACGAAGGE